MDIFTVLNKILPGDRLRRNENLNQHSTYQIGGPADVIASPNTLSELQELMAIVTSEDIPWMVLGNGSNIIFADEGYRGLVIKIRGSNPVSDTLCDLENEDDYIRAGAGISLPRLARFAASLGLSGLEFCAGIPGVLGGAVPGNVGAHGSELSCSLDSIDLLYPTGSVQTIPASEAGFSYRQSKIKKSCIVTGAVFKLVPDNPENIYERMKNYSDYRKRTQPGSEQSAGCMFKNPSGDKAGRLIELSGCKGLEIGGTQVSEKHANFIINKGGATASDAFRLIDLVREHVLSQTGVTLELEVRIIN
tara:strand:- start:3311 stop:4225 length:915 start_codon:yes stop_codon:yes gene_type:complete